MNDAVSYPSGYVCTVIVSCSGSYCFNVVISGVMVYHLVHTQVYNITQFNNRFISSLDDLLTKNLVLIFH